MNAPNTATGTDSRTEKGSDQLSYRAARIRNTKRSDGLARTVARRRCADHLRRPKQVESVRVFGSTDVARRRDGRERHHLVIAVPHVIARDVALVQPLLPFG